jgi:hypothetical protein
MTDVKTLDPGILPGPACLGQKAWFLPQAPPPAAAGHILVPGLAVAPVQGCFRPWRVAANLSMD